MSDQDLQSLQQLLAGRDRGPALETAGQLLARASSDPRALLALGQLLGARQELPLAERAFRQAAQLQPDSYPAHFNLGFTLYQEHKAQEALAPLTRAAELKPTAFEAAYLLGVTLSETGRRDDAIRRLRTARSLQPRHKGVLTLLGVLYVAGSYPLDAIEVLEPAAKLDPADGRVALLLVEAYHESYDFAKALAAAKTAVERLSDSAEARFRLGYESETAGAFEDAEQSYEQAIRLRPDYAAAHLALGRLQAKTGRYSEALGHLETVLRGNPASPEARLEMAKALIGSRDFPRAQQILSALAQEHPQDAAPHALLAQVYGAQGRTELSSREQDLYLALSRRSTHGGGMGGGDPAQATRRFVP